MTEVDCVATTLNMLPLPPNSQIIDSWCLFLGCKEFTNPIMYCGKGADAISCKVGLAKWRKGVSSQKSA
jgi:hypothetical protein